ncbi:MAG: Ig-like domain-containing protein [Deltaproteobacteria bacterium]|nr:Ig-like domain-containing protein [Deltaproteobacteria bacterium]
MLRNVAVFAVVAGLAVASCGDSAVKVSSPLFVSDTQPANGATTSAAALNVVAVSFSEAVAGDTLAGRVNLAAVGSWTDTGEGQAVALGAPLLTEDKLTAMYAVTAPLNPGTYCRITVLKEGIESASGNTMAADVRHYFLAE